MKKSERTPTMHSLELRDNETGAIERANALEWQSCEIQNHVLGLLRKPVKGDLF